MKYEIGQKINLENINFIIEIIARYPQAQSTIMNQYLGNSDYYRISINGAITYISEPILDIFLDLMTINKDSKFEPRIENDFKPIPAINKEVTKNENIETSKKEKKKYTFFRKKNKSKKGGGK